MEAILLAVFEALMGTAGSLGIAAGAERANSTHARKTLGTLQRRFVSARLSTLASIGGQVPDKHLEQILDFLKTPLGRHVLRTIVVAMLTRTSEPNAHALADAVAGDPAGQDDPLVKQLELSMALSQCVDGAATKECARALHGAISSIISDFASALRKLRPEEYRHIRAGLIADRQSDLVLNVVRANGTLQSLIHCDGVAAEAFAQRLRPLIHDATATVAAPYFQKRAPIPFADIYVPPSLIRPNFIAEDTDHTEDEGDESPYWEVDDLLSNLYRDVILGSPGAGKSTITQFLANKIAAPGYRDNDIIPFVVPIRDYDRVRKRDGASLCEFIAQMCRRNYQLEPPASAVEYLCATGRAVVLLDGLDEILEPHDRQDVVAAVTSFASIYSAASILVTSRLVGYDQAPLYAKVFRQTTLSPFTDGQVESYATRWFNGETDLADEDRDSVARSFLKELDSIGDDLRTNPLTLSLLCNVYRRIHSIPQNRAELYEECANLLFERWDRSRGIVSEGALRGEAREALQDVALWMYTRASTAQPLKEVQADRGAPSPISLRANGMTVGRSDLRRRLIRYWASRLDSLRLAEEMADSLIRSWEGRAWVLTDVGSDLSESRYGFTHQTFLEYFAATQLVRKNPSPGKLADALIPHLSAGTWDVVGEIAIQVINRNVEAGADKFVKRLLKSAASLTPGGQAAVVGFITRHLDSLPLGAATIRAVVRRAINMYLAAQQAFVEAPSHGDYNDSLWFNTELGWVGEQPEEVNEDSLPDTISTYLTMGADLMSDEQLERLAFALPALALMLCQVPAVVECAKDEVWEELVRICVESNDTVLASNALLVLLKPGQLDFGFLQVYSSLRPTWSFSSAYERVVTKTDARGYCQRLAGANFLVQAIGAQLGLLSFAEVLDIPGGWKALFVSTPDWLEGLDAVSPRGVESRSAADDLFRAAIAAHWTGRDIGSRIVDSFIQLGTWVDSHCASDNPDGWSGQGDVMDQAWLAGVYLRGFLESSVGVAGAGVAQSDWDAIEDPFSAENSDALDGILGHLGLLGLFFVAMVCSEADRFSSRELRSDEYGPLRGLVELLNSRLDGVPFLRQAWPGAERWQRYEHVRMFLSKWSARQLSLTRDTR